MLRHKLSMVVISALCIRDNCFIRCSSKGLSSTFFSRAASIFSFIWEAAALVNVTTRSSSISMPQEAPSSLSSPSTILIILSTRTAVLPEPAAADTRRSPPLEVITSLCPFVHFMGCTSFLKHAVFHGISSVLHIKSAHIPSGTIITGI